MKQKTVAGPNQSSAARDPELQDLSSNSKLKEGLDYYVENGLFVFTAAFLRRRGFCCESGCRHCPYQGRSVDRTLDTSTGE
ncbi:MAG TPA: DUF5522 domain-containing protein [Pyrinomonadaceae bacterium]|nr:DUF5522 domain-containing protein [Pyrinomonadaceae bacterium]